MVERSFGWVARFRRLSRDFERMPHVLAALHFVVFTILMLPKVVMALATGQSASHALGLVQGIKEGISNLFRSIPWSSFQLR